MNLLLLSLLFMQNVTSYFEHFKNGVNTQFVKDKVQCGPGSEARNLSAGAPDSHFKAHQPKIDVSKLDSLLSASNHLSASDYLNPFQYLLKGNESVNMFAKSASQLSPYRMSRKLNDDSSTYDDGEDDESFLETNESDKTNDKDEDHGEKDQFDEENAESFLEKDEFDEASDGDNEQDGENEDFPGEHEGSFLEKEEYDDAGDNEHDEFYDEDAESFLEQEEYEDLSDNENDEMDEDHGESFLEKEDGDEDSGEDNGKDYKEEYQNKMADDDYPDEYVGSDDSSNGSTGTAQMGSQSGSGKSGTAQMSSQSGGNMKELKNKENESFLEQNVNGHTEEEEEKHSTFVSSSLSSDNVEDKYDDEHDDEVSFLEEDAHSHSDDTFDDYYEDSFLERGKLGAKYSDYYEEDADEEDAKQANEDAFDNHHLNEISTTNDVHSFIQKDMEYIDEIIDDNETIKEAVKKGSKKAMKQPMHKPNLLEEEDFEEKESFSDDEMNGFMEESMDASKLDAKKAKTTLRSSEKKKTPTSGTSGMSGMSGMSGSGATSAATEAATNMNATNMNATAMNAAAKGNSEASKKQTDLSNEDLFNDELTEEVIADSYEEGGNVGSEEAESLTNAFDDKLLDQGVNENTLLNDNMIYNVNMVPHKKRELYISPHKHTSAASSKNGKHHAADADALDKKLRAHELLELENREGSNSVIVETEEVDVDLNGGKSSGSVSFLSSVVFLLIGLLCFTN
nr:rhoptry-associated membrane antigen [Plasmodium vivax]UZU83874.1 rhoptry-associated membrane antigen [Plasmodium vivax]UZU83876.1 rhoptry-associated membrane antigen [Plasmodium vivax]